MAPEEAYVSESFLHTAFPTDCLGFEEGVVLLFVPFYSSLEILTYSLVTHSLLCICCPNVPVQSTIMLEVMALNTTAVCRSFSRFLESAWNQKEIVL